MIHTSNNATDVNCVLQMITPSSWSHLAWQSVFIHRFQVPGTHPLILSIIPSDSVAHEQWTREFLRIQGALGLNLTRPPTVIDHAAKAIAWWYKTIEKTLLLVCFSSHIIMLLQLHKLMHHVTWQLWVNAMARAPNALIMAQLNLRCNNEMGETNKKYKKAVK